MCPTLVPAGALACLRLLAPLDHMPVFRVSQVMGVGGGQRSPLWATATGPGLFRSLGFRNTSGYWLFGGQRTTIQEEGRQGGAGACVCVLYRCSLGWYL